MNCSEIINRTIATLNKGFKCTTSELYTCIVTPYSYPDNDLIEIFVEQLGDDTVRVTDLGETLRHLESLGMDIFSSRNRKFLLEEIIRRLHVELNLGKLEKTGRVDKVGNLILDVVAASQSVGDLIYMSKAYEPATFPKEVSIFLTENEIEHKVKPSILGVSGRKYKVSVSVGRSISQEMLIEAMSPASQFQMYPFVNRVIRMWVDINGNRAGNKISLLNDIDLEWRPEDIAILDKWSKVHRWSQKEKLLEILR